MRKILLLLALMAAVCVGCDTKPNDDGPEIPWAPAKPKLGYVDFANWWQIFLKDVATAKPMIKGTMVSDQTTSRGERELVYEHHTDAGVATTYYIFDKNGMLHMISSAIEGDSLQDPINGLTRHLKVIADDLDSFIWANNGESQYFRFNISYDNSEQVGGRDSDLLYPTEMHSVLWKLVVQYANQYTNNDLHYEGDEFYSLREEWIITDEVDHPDSTTPYVRFDCGASSDSKIITINVKRENH